MNIFFHPDGTAACLHSDTIPLVQLGTLTVRRASQIEFNHGRQEWEVRLALQDGTISGDIVFSDPSRDACLKWEEKFFDLAGATPETDDALGSEENVQAFFDKKPEPFRGES